MELAHEKRGSVLIVKPLERQMDASSIADFKRQMEASIRDGQVRIVLDLAEVDFVDSSGLGAIIGSLRMLEGQGDLVIAGIRDKVMVLFKLTRMDRVFQIFPTSDEAVQHLLVGR